MLWFDMCGKCVYGKAFTIFYYMDFLNYVGLEFKNTLSFDSVYINLQKAVDIILEYLNS